MIILDCYLLNRKNDIQCKFCTFSFSEQGTFKLILIHLNLFVEVFHSFLIGQDIEA